MFASIWSFEGKLGNNLKQTLLGFIMKRDDEATLMKQYNSTTYKQFEYKFKR